MNILSVRSDNLCVGCGTCAGVCPAGAISMVVTPAGVYKPLVNASKCTGCSLCLSVCPADRFSSASYLESYTGYSINGAVRYNSSSGGLVTQVLLDALKVGLIDGALVTKMDKANPLLPVPFIARTKEEIIQASQSKYCPVTANVALKEIAGSRGKYAVVGLPCHIQGVRQAESRVEALKEKIALRIGLFCGHCPNFWSINTFLARQNIKDVTKVNFRGHGWPGKVTITSKNDVKQYPLSEYYGHYGSAYFIPKNCLRCKDMMAEASDISCGDVWLPEYKNDNIGHSALIVRTEAGKKAILNSIERGTIALKNTDVKVIKRSQAEAIYVKAYVSKPYRITDSVIYALMMIYSSFSVSPILRLLLRYLPIRLLMLLRAPCDILLSRRVQMFRRNYD